MRVRSSERVGKNKMRYTDITLSKPKNCSTLCYLVVSRDEDNELVCCSVSEWLQRVL